MGLRYDTKLSGDRTGGLNCQPVRCSMMQFSLEFRRFFQWEDLRSYTISHECASTHLYFRKVCFSYHTFPLFIQYSCMFSLQVLNAFCEPHSYELDLYSPMKLHADYRFVYRRLSEYSKFIPLSTKFRIKKGLNNPTSNFGISGSFRFLNLLYDVSRILKYARNGFQSVLAKLRNLKVVGYGTLRTAQKCNLVLLNLKKFQIY